MACLWLTPFLFFIFSSAQSDTSSLFSFSGSFSSILLTVFFSQHQIFNTFSQKDVLFTLLYCCFGWKIKSLIAENHGLFLKFCCLNSSSLIASRWFLLYFQPIRNHLEFALVLQISTRVTGELLSFLSQSELSNFFVYIISGVT